MAIHTNNYLYVLFFYFRYGNCMILMHWLLLYIRDYSILYHLEEKDLENVYNCLFKDGIHEEDTVV